MESVAVIQTEDDAACVAVCINALRKIVNQPVIPHTLVWGEQLGPLGSLNWLWNLFMIKKIVTSNPLKNSS